MCQSEFSKISLCEFSAALENLFSQLRAANLKKNGETT